MTIQRRIVAALRARHKEKPHPVGALIDQSTDDELYRLLFANYRGSPGQERGLAMSQGGFAIMRSYFRVYPVRFDPMPIYNAKHILYLDRTATMPWTVDHEGTLWLMDPEFAMRAKLVGDLDTLITAFAGYNS